MKRVISQEDLLIKMMGYADIYIDRLLIKGEQYGMLDDVRSIAYKYLLRDLDNLYNAEGHINSWLPLVRQLCRYALSDFCKALAKQPETVSYDVEFAEDENEFEIADYTTLKEVDKVQLFEDLVIFFPDNPTIIARAIEGDMYHGCDNENQRKSRLNRLRRLATSPRVRNLFDIKKPDPE